MICAARFSFLPFHSDLYSGTKIIFVKCVSNLVGQHVPSKQKPPSLEKLKRKVLEDKFQMGTKMFSMRRNVQGCKQL